MSTVLLTELVHPRHGRSSAPNAGILGREIVTDASGPSGLSSAGPVTRDDNFKVSAIVVELPPVNPALAYRFDFKDRPIAFSGDTAPLEAVAKMANGADVLVHETMYVPAMEEYIKGQIAKGRPVKFEAFMAHMKADYGAHEGRSHASRRRWPHRRGSRREDAGALDAGLRRTLRQAWRRQDTLDEPGRQLFTHPRLSLRRQRMRYAL